MKNKIILFIIERLAKLANHKVPPFSTVAAVITKGSKVLVVNLSYKKGYNLPGGVIEPGENLEEGLRREVKEETNLEIISMKYFGSATEAKGGLYTLVAGFEVKVKDGKSAQGSAEGNLEWVEPRAAYERCAYEDSKQLIRQYFGLK